MVYHSTDGDVESSITVQKYLTLPQKSDHTYDGKKYSFVGWSTDEKLAGEKNCHLSLEDSCDLYDYDHYDEDSQSSIGHVKKSVVEQYSLIGNCNPDKVNTVETENIATGSDGKIHLYPVYAVRGYSTAVTANEKSGDNSTAIVGISDWKSMQGEDHQYQNEKKEKWLGKINVEVYKDGELWTEKSKPMYFSYHNDDAADLNVKFIWDNLVKDEDGDSDEDKLYNYMSDTSRKTQSSKCPVSFVLYYKSQISRVFSQKNPKKCHEMAYSIRIIYRKEKKWTCKLM